MKKNSKERLFEVMGRLDKTFKPTLNEGSEETKPTLNEGFEGLDTTDDVAIPTETGEVPAEVSVEEKTPEEKLQELTAKVDEIYALVHDEGEEIPAEEIPSVETGEVEIETGEVEPENLQEWNFDKKKGDKEDKDDKEEKKEDSTEDKEEDKEEIDESDEVKPKIPVAAVAKVGK